MRTAGRFLIATSIAVAVVVATVMFAAQVVPGARSVLHIPDPVTTLQHDRAFMSVPTGATFWYEDGVCDSGQFSVTRHLHVAAPARRLRDQYERDLMGAGWTRAQPHSFRRRMRDHRVLYVGTYLEVSADGTGELTIYASVDTRTSLASC